MKPHQFYDWILKISCINFFDFRSLADFSYDDTEMAEIIYEEVKKLDFYGVTVRANPIGIPWWVE